jgi:cellulose synthase operon protein C
MSDSNVDIAELEMAFAKDPTSDAFLALSSAYLEQGRFMEAMVVCKKGIKSQPENAAGRLLLAKVYAGQGKVPKAIDEVKALLGLLPASPEGHFLLGQLHERSGRFAEAIEAFKAVLSFKPDHAEAIAALRAKGIEFEPPKAPEPPQPAARLPTPEPMITAGAPTPATGTLSTPPGATGVPRPARAATAPRSSEGGQMPAFISAYAGGYDPLSQAQGEKRFGLGFTVGLAGVLLVVLFGFILALRAHNLHMEELNEHLRQANKDAAGGNTAGLMKAGERLEKALQIDDGQKPVLAHLAYTFAVLTAERGQRGEPEEKAKKYLALAQKKAGDHPLTLAASMLRALYTGQADEAKAVLAKIEKGLGDGQPKPQLNVARGRYYRSTGQLKKLEPILESLRNAASDPSDLAWLALAYRTLGDDLRARLAVDQAIKTKDDNDPARAQRALLLLENRDLSNVPIALDDLTTLQDLGKNSVGEKQWGFMNIARAELNRFNDREQEYQRDLNAARNILGARDPELLFFEAKALSDQGKSAEAVAKLQDSLKVDRFRVLPWSSLVTFAADANMYSVANEALTEARALFPDAMKLLAAEVYLLAKQKKLTEAEALLRKRLESNDDAEVRQELGRVLLSQNKHGNAIEELKKAAEKSKAKPTLVRAAIYTLLGRAFATSGDDDLAVETYSEAISINGGYADAYFYLGGSLQRQSRNGPAKEAYEKYLKLDPTGSKVAQAKQRVQTL